MFKKKKKEFFIRNLTTVVVDSVERAQTYS